MWVLIFLAVLFVVLAFVVFVLGPWRDDFAVAGMIVVGWVLLFALTSIPFYRADTLDRLAQRDALQQSYNELRENPLEMATVGNEIADWNGWLASAKYWNGTQWRWWWPDDVRRVKPIR